MDEVPDKDFHKGMYGGKASILPQGITHDAIYAIIGTPRTKYGFVDNPWSAVHITLRTVC